MKKKILTLAAVVTLSGIGLAQNQTVNGNLEFASEYNSIQFPEKLGYSGGITGDDGNYKRLTLYHGHSIAFETGTNTRDFSKTKMYINEAGNVGIGTTSPKNKLEVRGGIMSSYSDDRYLSMFNSGDGNSYFNYIGGSTSSRIGFQIDGASKMSIMNNGNVGIGTTNPDSKLRIQGNHSLARFKTDDDGFFEIQATRSTESSKNANLKLSSQGDIILDPNAFGTTGNVGIGTISPTLKLHIKDPEGGAALGIERGGKIWRFDIQHTGDNLFLRNSTGETGNVFTFTKYGKLGIGTNSPDEMLTVKGKIHAEEVRVDLSVPADYVFEKYYTGKSKLKADYTMPTLEEVEAFTKANNHLPSVPSAKQIQEEGLHLKEMTNLLLQKVEELTLYTIEQEKQLKKQATLLEAQQKEIQTLKERIK